MVLDRLCEAWKVLWGRPSSGESASQEELLEARRRLAEKGLELQEAGAALAALRSRLENMEREARVKEEKPLDALLENLAAPLSQLRMQRHVLDSGSDISGRSVMALAVQVVGFVEKAGLEPVGNTGEEIPYDPLIAEPLSRDAFPTNGEAVIVRFVGYRYQGKVLRKALVERKDQ